MFLIRAQSVQKIIRFEPNDQGAKYLLMRQIAHEVDKVDADAVILMGEAWAAPFAQDKPYMRAVDAEGKIEILMATLVQKDGTPTQRSAEMKRDGSKLTLGETQTQTNGAHFMFAPIYEVWGKAIPAEWRLQPK